MLSYYVTKICCHITSLKYVCHITSLKYVVILRHVQVEYLCEKGADVNRGQRSSSLHYAACFGRPLIAKVNNDPNKIVKV